MKIELEQGAIRGRARLLIRIERADGLVEALSPIPNSRVDTGAAWMFNRLSGQGTPGPGTFIAFSENTQNITKGQSALPSEITGGGLGRASGVVQNYVVPTVLDGAASYQITRTFVYTDIAPRTVAAAGIFDAVSGGSLIWVFNISPSRTVNLNDRVTVTLVVEI